MKMMEQATGPLTLEQRITLLEQRADNSGQLIDQHADVINNALTARKVIDQSTEFLKASTDLTDKMFGSAQVYTTVVIGGGFAAALTMWSYLNEKMPSALVGATGALLIFSVAAFVLSEVANLALRTFSAFSIRSLPSPSNGSEAGTYLQKVESALQHSPSKVFYIVQLFCTVLPGTIAVAIMLWKYIALAMH